VGPDLQLWKTELGVSYMMGRMEWVFFTGGLLKISDGNSLVFLRNDWTSSGNLITTYL